MKNVLWGLVVVAAFCGCGGGGGGDDAGDTNGEASTSVSFQLNAEVAEIVGDPPFIVEPSDEVVVRFGYDAAQPPSAQENIYSIRAHGLNARLNDEVIGTSTLDSGSYEILVEDDGETDFADRLRLLCQGESIAEPYALEKLQIALVLVDSSGEVFAGQSLPGDLQHEDFDSGYLVIAGVEEINILEPWDPDFLQGSEWSVRADFDSFFLRKR